ncbi:unnamed protein product, partial [Brassica rapa subsp. trilocularis]
MTEQVAPFGYDYTKDVGAGQTNVVSHSVEPWQLEDYQPPCHLQMELQNRDIYSEETIPHLGTLHKDMFLYQLLSTKGTRNPRFYNRELGLISLFQEVSKQGLVCSKYCIRSKLQPRNQV